MAKTLDLLGEIGFVTKYRNIKHYLSERNKLIRGSLLVDLWIFVYYLIMFTFATYFIKTRDGFSVVFYEATIDLAIPKWFTFGNILLFWLICTLLTIFLTPKILRKNLKIYLVLVVSVILFVLTPVIGLLFEDSPLSPFIFSIYLIILLFLLSLLTSNLIPAIYLKSNYPHSLLLLYYELLALRESLKRNSAKQTTSALSRIHSYLDSVLSQAIKHEKLESFCEKAVTNFNNLEKKIDINALDEYMLWLKNELLFPAPATLEIETKTNKNKSSNKFADFLQSIFLSFHGLESLDTKISDLHYKKTYPVTNQKIVLPEHFDEKGIKKVVRYHLLRAREYDTSSAHQRFASLWLFQILNITSITFSSIAGYTKPQVLLPSFSTTFLVLILLVFYHLSIKLILQRAMRELRKSGYDIYYSKSYYIYENIFLVCSYTIFLRFLFGTGFLDMVSTGIGVSSKQLIFIMFLFFQAIALFLIFRPITELSKSALAISLLIRELLRLRTTIPKLNKIEDRKKISQNIYFIKKYFSLSLNKLTDIRYDTKTQKSVIKSFLFSVNQYLDGLTAELKLGSSKIEFTALKNLDTIILHLVTGTLSEIPVNIPDFPQHVELKQVQSGQTSFLRRVIRLLDTSNTVRLIAIIIVFIVINTLNPLLWSSIQNFSSVFQFLIP